VVAFPSTPGVAAGRQGVIVAAVFILGLVFGSTTACHARDQREFRRGHAAGVYDMQCEAIRQGHAQWTNLPVMGRQNFLWFPGRAAFTDPVP
jgi:hypothetical protein